ncbi:MAG: hypothetical protein J6F30_15570 [Cellulosilyticum sp.]|nr:hypothetical protein [Cellulosilyticum sp.]
MIKRKDYLAILTIVFMMITSITGILSLDFTYSYEFINQYGHSVQMYGYGIYAFDTYFQAPISIGTDICILFVLVPVFIYSYVNYARKNDKVSELKLISVYAVALYYGASIAFGLTYNQLFLIYLGLFSSSLFGMFLHIKNIEWEETCSISKGLKVFLTLSGVALIVAWLPDIIPSLIKGTTLQLIGVYTTVITYVLDMGIISPLCFVCIYLLNKKSPLGTVLLAIMLKLCMIVGIMMISQTICQLASGCNLPLGAILTKSFSFVLLGGFAFYFNQKMYKELIG